MRGLCAVPLICCEDFCEDVGQLVSTVFQTDWCNTIWAWWFFSFSASGRPGALRLRWSDLQLWGRGGLLELLMVVWRGVQSGWWVFFQTCNRTHLNRLPVVDSTQWWWMVSCSCLSLSDLSTLMLNHWKRIGSLAYRNNSFLPPWSPFPGYIWPVYTRCYPPSCKHLLWPDRAVWVFQWTMVCRCCRLNKSR